MSSRSDGRARARVPLALVPFLAYAGVTVLEPAAHGAARAPAFWEHAAITLAVSGSLAWAWHLGARRAARRGTSASPRA